MKIQHINICGRMVTARGWGGRERRSWGNGYQVSFLSWTWKCSRNLRCNKVHVVTNTKPAFTLSSFTFIKRLFSSSSLSAVSVVWSAYLKLLMFLLAILIPACASSSLAFCMMCSAYKLYVQGDNIRPWRTPFPIWNQSVVPSLVLLLLDLHTGFSGGR